MLLVPRVSRAAQTQTASMPRRQALRARSLRQVLPEALVQRRSPGATMAPASPQAHRVLTNWSPLEWRAYPVPMTAAQPPVLLARKPAVTAAEQWMALTGAILAAFAHNPTRRSSVTRRQRGHASADLLPCGSAKCGWCEIDARSGGTNAGPGRPSCPQLRAQAEECSIDFTSGRGNGSRRSCREGCGSPLRARRTCHAGS
jgi:hypothetical protein